MPSNVVKTKKDEKLWARAKTQAKEQGKGDNYAYIMSIYQSMKNGDSSGEKTSAFVRGYERALSLAYPYTREYTP